MTRLKDAAKYHPSRCRKRQRRRISAGAAPELPKGL